MDAFNTGPPYSHIRRARPSDIMRIGIICCAGFRYSPIFRWERSHHEDYPEDTLLSYRRSFADAIADENSVVYVALDKYNPFENKFTTAKFPTDDTWNPPKEDSMVPVAVAWIKLPAGSTPVDECQLDKAATFLPPAWAKRADNTAIEKYPDLPENEDRDLDRSHYDSWGKASAAAKREHLQEHYTLEMLVTHPAYWKRGHATSLVQRSIELIGVDAKLGVNAAGMGESLYASLGFKEISQVKDGWTEDGANGVKTTIYAYDPRSTPQRSKIIVRAVKRARLKEWKQNVKLVVSAMADIFCINRARYRKCL